MFYGIKWPLCAFEYPFIHPSIAFVMTFIIGGVLDIVSNVSCMIVCTDNCVEITYRFNGSLGKLRFNHVPST